MKRHQPEDSHPAETEPLTATNQGLSILSVIVFFVLPLSVHPAIGVWEIVSAPAERFPQAWNWGKPILSWLGIFVIPLTAMWIRRISLTALLRNRVDVLRNLVLWSLVPASMAGLMSGAIGFCAVFLMTYHGLLWSAMMWLILRWPYGSRPTKEISRRRNRMRGLLDFEEPNASTQT